MQAFTTTRTMGQFMSHTPETFAGSLSTTKTIPNFVVLKFIVQPLPDVATISNVIDEKMLAQLYVEFAEEDRALANAGLADYARMLAAEDAEE